MTKKQLIQKIENHPLISELWYEEENGWWANCIDGYVSHTSEGAMSIHFAEYWQWSYPAITEPNQYRKDVIDLREMWNDIKTSKIGSYLGTIVTQKQFDKETEEHNKKWKEMCKEILNKEKTQRIHINKDGDLI